MWSWSFLYVSFVCLHDWPLQYIFKLAQRQVTIPYLLSAACLKLLTQDSVRITAGFINCIWSTCVELRERSGDVCSYSTLFMCDYPCYCYALECFCVSVFVCSHCISTLLGYIVCCLRASCSLFFCFFIIIILLLCTMSSPFSSFPSSDHLFQGQLFRRLTREWYRRLLPRSISSKWSKGEFTLLTSSCTVAVLTFNCLSVFRANSHLVPDNCAIPGLPRLACHSLGHHLKQPLIA